MNRLEKWHHNSICMEAAIKCITPPSTTEEIMALGYPSSENIFERPGYVISYNYKRTVSKWVCECLTHGQVFEPPLSRTNTSGLIDFEEDADIDSSRRATLAEYTNWPKEKCQNGPLKEKYQKGHLAAAGNHRYNFKAYCSTFFLSNIVPMYPNVNKTIGEIETQARKFALKRRKVYTITGTYFHRNWFEIIFKRAPNFVSNSSKVQVPDAIFKVVVQKIAYKHYKYKVQAYFVKNLPNENQVEMENTKIYLADLKKKTGLNLLSEIPLHLILEDKIKLEDKKRQSMLRLCPKWLTCIWALYQAYMNRRTDLNIRSEADNHTVDEDYSPNQRRSRNIGL